MLITGLGPHGECAIPADQVVLSESEAEAARAGRFTVAVVLHTTSSDWSRQELAGIVTTLGTYSAAVVEVVDCGFDMDSQTRALRRLASERVDAVISIPIGNASVAEAHRTISLAGKTLILLDNAPTGLLPGTDYAGVISTDNFGLGVIAAELLSPHLPEEGVAGMRYRGYRPAGKRFIVFQALQHTMGFPPEIWRVLDKCHTLRNQVEYGGYFDVDEQLLKDLIRCTIVLEKAIGKLAPL